MSLADCIADIGQKFPKLMTPEMENFLLKRSTDSGGDVQGLQSIIDTLNAEEAQLRQQLEDQGVQAHAFEQELVPGDLSSLATDALQSADGPRGRFTPADIIQDQDGNPVNLIQIFEKGDSTTFLHESGHFWLEQLKSDANEFGADIMKDWKTVTKWWGQNSLAIKDEAIKRAKEAKDKEAVTALQGMSDAQVKKFVTSGELRGEGTERFLSVAMHEQFARGVENYFSTGTAPSIALADAFNAFAQWVKLTYRKMRGLDVKFSPEVTGVMDRMLASDAEIELASSQYELSGLFKSAEEAGLTKKQFAKHQENIARQKNQSKANQMAKRAKQLETERTKWWKDEREGLREETEKRLAREPIYKMVYSMSKEELADGTPVEIEQQLNPIDTRGMKALLPEGKTVKDLPRVGGKALHAMDTEDGKTILPTTASAAFGYPDAETMVDELLAYVPFKDAVESDLNQQMHDKYGDMDVDGEVEAIASVHGDHTAKVLAFELAALRTTEKALDLAFLKAYARKRVLDATVEETRATKYLTAEKRHARAAGVALRKGDRAEAYKHQFQRLVNHYMAAEAQRFQKKRDKQLAYMREFQKPKKQYKGLDADYVDNIKAIVAAYDFGPKVSKARREKAELQSVHEFVQAQMAGEDAILSLPEWLTLKDSQTHFRDLTVGEFNELHDSIKQMEKQGRLKKKLIVAGELRDRQEVIAQLLVALAGRDKAKVNKWRKQFGKNSTLHNAAAWIANVDSQLLKVEQLLESLDGQPLGIWHQSIYQPIADAAAARQDLDKEFADVVTQKLGDMSSELRKGLGERVEVEGLDMGPLTRSNLIMLVLNTGNTSNLDKLIRSYDEVDNFNITEEGIQNAQDMLTKEEEELVQAVWDSADKLWPAVQQVYRREYGVAPDPVEHISRTTKNGVELKGGYFPMIYDRSVAGGAVESKLERLTAIDLMKGELGQAAVNSSMTKGRTGYSGPVEMDITMLPGALQNTTHYITHYEAVRNVRRIIGNKEVSAELANKVGQPYLKQIEAWLGAVAVNGQQAGIQKTAADSLVTGLASNVTIGVLAGSYSTMMAQVMGLFTAVDRLAADDTYAPWGVARATKDIAAATAKTFDKQHREMVYELSGEMRHRLENTDRELKANFDRLSGKTGPLVRAQMASMLAIAAVQLYGVDMATWTAAYNRALKNEPDNLEGAVRYADRTLRITQATGNLKDLSSIQRQKGIIKAVTMFYTYFSALYGILRGLGKEVVDDKYNPMAYVRGAARIAVLLTLQELVMGAIKGELPDLEPDDEEDDDLVSYLGRKTFLTGMGTIPIARDIASAAVGDFGYSPTPLSLVGDNMNRAITKMSAHLEDPDVDISDLDFKTLQPLIMALGTVGGIPGTVQGLRTMDGWVAKMDEEDNWSVWDLLRGYDPERAERNSN